MTTKKAFPLRIDERILAAMRSWSDDELRSVNAQIEYVLRETLRKVGRLDARGGNESESVSRPTQKD